MATDTSVSAPPMAAESEHHRRKKEQTPPPAPLQSSSAAASIVAVVGSPSPSIGTDVPSSGSIPSTLATAPTSHPVPSAPGLHDAVPPPTGTPAPLPSLRTGLDASSSSFEDAGASPLRDGGVPASAASASESGRDRDRDRDRDGSERTSGERTAEARAALLATLTNVGGAATAPLEARAADFAANTAVLQKQEDAVRAETQGLARVTAEYARVADEARGRLKELGHVQNWAEMLERDLLVLEETMRIVDEEEGGRGDGAREGDGEGEEDEQGKGKGRAKASGRAEDQGSLRSVSGGLDGEQKKGRKGWW